MTRTISSVSLLVSLLAGPIVWFAHFVLVWGVVEFGCRINFVNMEIVSPTSIRQFVIVATIIALLAVVIGEALAYRHLTAERREVSSGWAFEDRHRFLTIDAMILNAFFLFSIVATAMPAFFLTVCDLPT